MDIQTKKEKTSQVRERVLVTVNLQDQQRHPQQQQQQQAQQQNQQQMEHNQQQPQQKQQQLPQQQPPQQLQHKPANILVPVIIGGQEQPKTHNIKTTQEQHPHKPLPSTSTIPQGQKQEREQKSSSVNTTKSHKEEQRRHSMSSSTSAVDKTLHDKEKHRRKSPPLMNPQGEATSPAITSAKLPPIVTLVDQHQKQQHKSPTLMPSQKERHKSSSSTKEDPSAANSQAQHKSPITEDLQQQKQKHHHHHHHRRHRHKSPVTTSKLPIAANAQEQQKAPTVTKSDEQLKITLMNVLLKQKQKEQLKSSDIKNLQEQFKSPTVTKTEEQLKSFIHNILLKKKQQLESQSQDMSKSPEVTKPKEESKSLSVTKTEEELKSSIINILTKQQQQFKLPVNTSKPPGVTSPPEEFKPHDITKTEEQMKSNLNSLEKQQQQQQHSLNSAMDQTKSPAMPSSDRDKDSTLPDDIDDFDEQLCFELEEVGKELDRYKEEVSKPSSEKVPSTKDGSPSSSSSSSIFSSSPPASPFPVSLCKDTVRHSSPSMHSSTSVAATESHGTAAGGGRKDSSALDKSEDESECRVKALTSLRLSLVGKVKMLITHKKNLSLQKDSLLENFDGDKNKLIKSLMENVAQCKQIDTHIQDLNGQIATTNKKIVDIRRSMPSVNSEDVEKDLKFNAAEYEANLSETYMGQTNGPSPSVISKEMFALLNQDTASSQQKTPPGKEARDTHLLAEKINDLSSISDSRISTPPQGHDARPARMPSEAEEEDNGFCEVLRKLSGQLAVHPASKTTLWCNTCNLFFVSIKSYLKHLETSEHLAKVEAMGEKSVYKIFSSSSYLPEKEDEGSILEEAFGVEFLMSAKVIFCSLCACLLPTKEAASSHAQSLQHTVKYKEYLLSHTSKEMNFLKDKMAAFEDYCRRRKATATAMDRERQDDTSKSHYNGTYLSNVKPGSHSMDRRTSSTSPTERVAGGISKRHSDQPTFHKRLKMDTDRQV